MTSLTPSPRDSPETAPVPQEPLPAALEAALAAVNGAKDSVLIAVPADLTRDGSFGEEWVVLTHDRLLTFEPKGDGFIRRMDVPLKALKSPTTDSLVGGAALYATIDGQSVEIARYTNARQREFGRVAKFVADVAKYHETIAKGEETPDEPKLAEDAEAPRRCPTCNLLLPEGTKVCPACLNKGKVLRRILVQMAES